MTELAYLEKVDPSRRMMRFYAIWIGPTLFGEWAMVREWGRVGSPGRLRESWFETEKIANQAGMNLKKGRRHADIRRSPERLRGGTWGDRGQGPLPTFALIGGTDRKRLTQWFACLNVGY